MGNMDLKHSPTCVSLVPGDSIMLPLCVISGFISSMRQQTKHYIIYWWGIGYTVMHRNTELSYIWSKFFYTILYFIEIIFLRGWGGFSLLRHNHCLFLGSWTYVIRKVSCPQKRVSKKQHQTHTHTKPNPTNEKETNKQKPPKQNM